MSNQNIIQEYHIVQSIQKFPLYVKKVEKQVSWFSGSFSFVAKKAALSLGYNTYTVSLMPIIIEYFKQFGVNQQKLVSFLQHNKNEIINYTNRLFAMCNAANARVNGNTLAFMEHTAHANRIGTITDIQKQQIIDNPKNLVLLVKNGTIDKDTFFYNVTLNLFVEYMAEELGIVKKVIPKWLRWLF